MGGMRVTASVVGLPADEVYRRIAAFPDYPGLCDAVREVKVLEADERHMVADWEVKFHRGILRWTERAEFFPADGLITFDEVAGDVDEFRGYWKVDVADGASGDVGVEFSVAFEIGIPTLEHILDPIAEEALHENVRAILLSLLGDAVTVEPAPTAAGQARP